MTNLLNSLGWAILAFLGTFPLLLILASRGVTLKPPVFWCSAVALAVFLLTLP